MNKTELINIVFDKIIELTENKIQKEDLNKDTVILSTGLDSLDYAHIMLTLEEVSNISPDENTIDWGNIKTIDQLVSLFAE